MMNLLFKKSYKIMLQLTILLLGITSTHAQQSVVVHGQVPLVPYDMEIVIDGEGKIEGTIRSFHKYANLTLKRGVVSSRSGSVVSATYDTLVSTETEDGDQHQSMLQVSLETTKDYSSYEDVHTGRNEDRCPICDLLFDIVDSVADGSDSDLVEFEIYGEADQTDSLLVELHFEPSNANDQLIGEPSYLFNDPAFGEVLRAVLPLPIPGETEIFELTVQSRRSGNAPSVSSSPAQIRVKIKHTI